MVCFSTTFGLGLTNLFAQYHDVISLIAMVIERKKKREKEAHPFHW